MLNSYDLVDVNEVKVESIWDEVNVEIWFDTRDGSAIFVPTLGRRTVKL